MPRQTGSAVTHRSVGPTSAAVALQGGLTNESDLQMGGTSAERVFITLLRHLSRGVFRPHLVVLRSEGEFASLVPDDVVVHTLDSDRHSLLGVVRIMSRTRSPRNE